MINIECQKNSNNNTVAIIVFRSVEHPRISSSLGVGILEKDLQIENINSVVINVQELALQIQESNKTSHDEIENIIIKNVIFFAQAD